MPTGSIDCPGCVQHWDHDGTDQSVEAALAEAERHVEQFHRSRLDPDDVRDFNHLRGNL